MISPEEFFGCKAIAPRVANSADSFLRAKNFTDDPNGKRKDYRKNAPNRVYA